MVRTDPFTQCHPLVNFAFFVSVLGISMFCLHPVILVISYLSATLYAIALKGFRHVLTLNAAFIIPGIIVVALINPMFNHNGVTLLYTFDNGNSLTLEAIVYGIVLAGTLAVATSWFVSINAVLTRDKFVYAVGRVFPTASLILSMSFRFIPLFIRQYKATAVSQKYLGSARVRTVSTGKQNWWSRKWQKVRTALAVTSALFTWSLENAIHVSDSMKARAYGRRRRTSYTPYRWDARNVGLLCGIVVGAALVIASILSGGVEAQYDPSIAISGMVEIHATAWTWIGIVVFAVFANLPLTLRGMAALQWRLYERRASSGSQADRRLSYTSVVQKED